MLRNQIIHRLYIKWQLPDYGDTAPSKNEEQTAVIPLRAMA